MYRINLQQALLAIAALISGVFVYLFVRSQASTYLVTGFLQPLNITIFPSLLFADQLPSFLHTFAFILLTYLLLGVKSHKAFWASATLWMVIELLFEIGQVPIIGQYLVSLTPEWFSHFSMLEMVDSFFLTGTYDVLDVLAILLAALAAWLTIRATLPREDDQDEY